MIYQISVALIAVAFAVLVSFFNSYLEIRSGVFGQCLTDIAGGTENH